MYSRRFYFSRRAAHCAASTMIAVRHDSKTHGLFHPCSRGPVDQHAAPFFLFSFSTLPQNLRGRWTSNKELTLCGLKPLTTEITKNKTTPKICKITVTLCFLFFFLDNGIHQSHQVLLISMSVAYNSTLGVESEAAPCTSVLLSCLRCGYGSGIACTQCC